MAVTATRPSGRRADDTRALKRRFRTLTFSGNYTTGGEVISARSLGFYRILGVNPLDHMARAANGVTGNPVAIDVAADGRSVTIRMMEDAAGAAGVAFGQEKTNAEAYIASQRLDVEIIGEG